MNNKKRLILYIHRSMGLVLAGLSTLTLQAQTEQLPEATNSSHAHKLDEVVVKALRPLVKVKADGGKLYDAEQLTQNRPIANTLDLLLEIPGIEQLDDNMNLLGTGNTLVVINGRRTNMSPKEMITYLSTLPPSLVKSIEVYYDAPPQFGVRGGVINVVLQRKRSDKLKVNGSAWTSVYQAKKYYQTAGAVLNLYQKKWMWETGLSSGFMKSNKRHVFESYHSLDGTITEVNNVTKRYSNSSAMKLASRCNYDFSKKSKLDVSYIYRTDEPCYTSLSPLYMDGEQVSASLSDFDVAKKRHIFQANYAYQKLNVGGNFLYYKEVNTQDMCDVDDKERVLEAHVLQKVKDGDFYLNDSRSIGKGQLRYGVDMRWTDSRLDDHNHWLEEREGNEKRNNVQKEQNYEVYGGWVQKMGRLNLSAQLQLSYYHSELQHNGQKMTLWNYVSLFPSATINYKVTEASNLVFSMSTNRLSPPYSISSGRKAYFNTYISIANSPLVEPYRSYDLHLNYVVKGRYTVGLYSSIAPHKYTQLLYQDPKMLKASFEYFNLTRNEDLGGLLVLPHNWTNRVMSRLSAFGLYRYQAGEFHGVSFDNGMVSGKFQLTNNAVLGKRKNLALQLNTTYSTKVMAAYAEDAAIFNSSFAMTWTPYHTGWSIILKGTDLLGTARHKRTVNYGNQHYSMTQHNDTQKLLLTIRYNFKGYKQRKEKTVDESRLGLE